MEDHQKTRGLLLEELQRERRDADTATILLRAAEYAFTHLSFDHFDRRNVLAKMRDYLKLPATGSEARAYHVLADLASLPKRED